MVSAGIIIETNGEMAVVKVLRSSSCGDNCHGCTRCDEKVITSKAYNPSGFTVGDRVNLYTESKKFLLACFVIYIVPIILPLIIFALFSFFVSSFIATITSAISFVILFTLMFIFGRSEKGKLILIPTITEKME